MTRYILALDQGTTGSTAMLVDDQLNEVSKANCEFPQLYPKPGWVEHRDLDIWNSLREAVNRCFTKAQVDRSQIAAIGITNQRETTCLFDKNSRALHNFVVWQCKRSQNICSELKDAGHLDVIRRKTGLLLDPYFSGTKLKWLFEQNPDLLAQAKARTLRFGTIDSWLLHRLTGGKSHKTDVTNASRTLLMNLETLEWDDELLSIFEVPQSCLPEIVSNAEIMGTTAGLDFLPDGIPISGMAGDQQSALIGQACFKKGETKATFGTGSFILMNTGDEIVPSSKGLLTTLAFKIGDKTNYCLEGSGFVAGAAVQWLRDNLGLIKTSEEVEGLARTVAETGDLVFVPALSGLGTPYWRPEARGLIRGISRDTNAGHLARAALEGIALQNLDIMNAMQADAGEMSVVKVDGGASRNNLLMQFHADMLKVPCQRPQNTETTALGAATLAGLGVGLFESEQAVSKTWQLDRQFWPTMAESERDNHLTKWNAAVEAA